MPRSALTGSNTKPTQVAASSATSKGKKLIKVYLEEQIVEAYDGTERVFRFACVTGEWGKTDRGKFKIREKFPIYRSRTYDAQMNYAMFFTADRKGFHQYHGPLPIALLRQTKRHITDYVGSKGCVRLREADAAALFEWTPRKTEVLIS